MICFPFLWVFHPPLFFSDLNDLGSFHVRRLFVTCGVFARYFFVAFSWLFRGFFVALFCLEKQCLGLFRGFFVVFSWLFRGFFVAPVLGNIYAYSPWNSLLIMSSWKFRENPGKTSGKWFPNREMLDLVAHHCCDPCRVTQCNAHNVAAHSRDFRNVAGVSRYTPHLEGH